MTPQRFSDLALGESFTFTADPAGLWVKVGARKFSGGRTIHRVGTIHVRVEVIRLVRQHREREGVRQWQQGA